MACDNDRWAVVGGAVRWEGLGGGQRGGGVWCGQRAVGCGGGSGGGSVVAPGEGGGPVEGAVGGEEVRHLERLLCGGAARRSPRAGPGGGGGSPEATPPGATPAAMTPNGDWTRRWPGRWPGEPGGCRGPRGKWGGPPMRWKWRVDGTWYGLSASGNQNFRRFQNYFFGQPPGGHRHTVHTTSHTAIPWAQRVCPQEASGNVAAEVRVPPSLILCQRGED